MAPFDWFDLTSRGFSDALTELLETVVRNRRELDTFEESWNAIRAMVERERQSSACTFGEQNSDQAIDSLTRDELRQLLKRVPPVVLRRAMRSQPPNS